VLPGGRSVPLLARLAPVVPQQLHHALPVVLLPLADGLRTRSNIYQV
jgi:hypothetical protein